MTEKELRQSVADAALGWLGRREADGGHREILAVYNAIRPLPAGYRMKDTDPWCAAFVSAAAAKAGLTEIVFAECSCPRMAKLYRAAGRWEEIDFAVPKKGDVVFYDWDGDRVPDHVGLVVEAAGDYITVIEGNKSDAVGKRRVHLDDKHILGYGQPNYFHYADKTGSVGAGALDGPQTDASSPSSVGSADVFPPEGGRTVGADAPDGPQTDASSPSSVGSADVFPPEGGRTVGADAPDGPQTDASSPSSVGSADIFPPEGGRTVGADAPGGPQTLLPDAALMLPTLGKNDFGEAVRAAQLLLIGRGFSCGRCGADGDFGPDTRRAALRCQRRNGLEPDGVVGPLTWAALLGVSA